MPAIEPAAKLALQRHYVAARADRPVALSGRLDDPQWGGAGWSDEFVDILGSHAPKPRFRTRMKMMWDDEHLYIGAELEEPHVWATLTEHDSVIFHDNDFEVFVDPDGDCQLYGELEINALNTTWDLLLVKPYRAGGPAINGWEIKGLRTAVHVDGTLNDPTDTDRGWSVEIAIPWASLSEIAHRNLPPKAGDFLRINFSRVQWEHEIVDGKYRKVPGRPEDNWVWSPQGVVDMHRPERWGWVHFSSSASEPPREPATLFEVYEAQRLFRGHHGHWSSREEELGLAPIPGLRIETTASFLELSLGDWRLDHDSRLWRVS
ncbi:carbohydrate-binding family 9-like protein [Fimbriimonas ginsengisoli]|uniref:Carbohydrate-binding domain-containing protein n=1 Tax=Fimbriimonas ginsengisoli Gsoil 348 TaxID=661478 RepID=A0A068NQC3_FIMGI|nr:carbohydrate-binding family 9-like protein [Fimbriimonas ginsengisoli]AIE84955.1 hypothetical protein OP10G_1587 [Fimbriimonas ginsengisoli Gsoil 348]